MFLSGLRGSADSEKAGAYASAFFLPSPAERKPGRACKAVKMAPSSLSTLPIPHNKKQGWRNGIPIDVRSGATKTHRVH
ncbi:MAG: hypothetical protein ACK5PJ_01875, partial [Ralstonia sp.]